jgi:hypothetical protein
MGLAHENGLLATYKIAAIDGVGGFATDYPPLALVILGVVARVGGFLRLDDFVALKISLLIATLGCASVMAVWDRRWQPTLGAAAYGALILDAMLLVYIDVYFIFVLLLALYFLRRGFEATGAALFALSVFIKWQPIVLGPFVFLYLVKGPERLTPARLFRIFGPALLVIAAVGALFGESTIRAFIRGIFQDPTFSGSALNLNWLATAVIEFARSDLHDHGGKVFTLNVGGYPIFERISNALRIVTFLTVLAHFYLSDRKFVSLLQSSIVGFLCYFNFGSAVHENHSLIVAILALCLIGTAGVGQIQALVLVALVNVNLILFFGLSGTAPAFSRVVLGVDVSIYLSLLNLAVFAVLWVPISIEVWSHLVATARDAAPLLRRRVAQLGLKWRAKSEPGSIRQ